MSLQLETCVTRIRNFLGKKKVGLSIGALLILSSASVMFAQFVVKDPGVRAGSIDSGSALSSVAGTEAASYFMDGQSRFQEVESVTGGTHNGLGPRFNSNSCSSCHAQPTIGGSSPSSTVYPFVGPNPETLVTNLNPTQNPFPSFITIDGPAREARFKFFLNRDGSVNTNNPDGGVHDLFVISGRPDAGSCSIRQPDFNHNLRVNNVIFRIPTPTFGLGLVEATPDATLQTNLASTQTANAKLGIAGDHLLLQAVHLLLGLLDLRRCLPHRFLRGGAGGLGFVTQRFRLGSLRIQ